eukprot:scaffold28078_cov57-Phaeocystis_antarctica.AAC.2
MRLGRTLTLTNPNRTVAADLADEVVEVGLGVGVGVGLGFRVRVRQGLCAFKGSTGGLSQPLACPEYILSVRLGAHSLPEFAKFTPIRPNSTNSRPSEHGSTPVRAPTLPPSAPNGSIDSLSPGRIYGTTSLDTGTNSLAPIGAAARFPDLMVSRNHCTALGRNRPMGVYPYLNAAAHASRPL